MLSSTDVIEQLTTEDIFKIMHDLGADPLDRPDGQGNYIFPTICHHEDAADGSYKLYFFPDTKLFYCYTHCGQIDLFEIVRRRKNLPDFYSAFRYVVQYFGIQDTGFEEPEKIEDWDVLNRMKSLQKRNEISKKTKEHKFIEPNILEYYSDHIYPQAWLKEGIKPEVMDYYNIRVDSCNHNIIIPHYDKDGHLVGLRRRTYDLQELERGKYSPVFLEGDMYNHPLGDHLYGLYQNKDAIQRCKRVILFEAEKSVMQLASFMGVDECCGVATCGSSLSATQIKLLLQLGVEEVILAYDREFEGKRGDPDTIAYENKLNKVIRPLLPYVRVYVIMDYDHLTKLKDSPTDRGADVFYQLLEKKIYVSSIKGD